MSNVSSELSFFMPTSIGIEYVGWSASTFTENSFVDLQSSFIALMIKKNSLLIELMWNVTHSLVGRFYFITKRYSLLARLLIIARERVKQHTCLPFVNDPNWHIMCLKPTIISIHRRDFLFLLCSPIHPTSTCVCVYTRVTNDVFVCLWWQTSESGIDISVDSHTYMFDFYSG